MDPIGKHAINNEEEEYNQQSCSEHWWVEEFTDLNSSVAR